MTSNTTLRVLIVDGYAESGRRDLDDLGCLQGGPLYRQMLEASLPEDCTCEADIVYPADDTPTLPQGTDLQKYHGVAWTGSTLTIHKNEPRVTRQIDYARSIFRSGVPQFGSCWAAQIAASAAGGVCTANPKGREFGLSRKVKLTDAGQTHPMFRGKPTVFDAFTVHFDIVETMPPNARLLASNNATDVQALDVRYESGSFWAVQYHPEFTLDYLARIATGRATDLIASGLFHDDATVRAFASDWSTLDANPERHDLAWRHGIDDDILDTEIRWAEARNWLQNVVVPRARIP